MINKGTSWDFISDTFESLKKDDCQYTLIIGKPGFKTTHVFCDIGTPADARAAISGLMQAMRDEFPDEKDFQF